MLSTRHVRFLFLILAVVICGNTSLANDAAGSGMSSAFEFLLIALGVGAVLFGLGAWFAGLALWQVVLVGVLGGIASPFLALGFVSLLESIGPSRQVDTKCFDRVWRECSKAHDDEEDRLKCSRSRSKQCSGLSDTIPVS